MLNILGVSDSLVLFQSGDSGVIIDKNVNLVLATGNAETLFASRQWDSSSLEAPQSMFDLAQGALADLEIKVIVASGRLYTIPRGVQAEAKKAIEWRREHKRGGTPVGMNTARTLAEGGQIGIEKVRHIAKYFPRHEIDKKAEGWKPGDKNFPSRGRIAWALWGGDAGWRWAQAIVERENKKALTVDGYPMPGYEPDFDEFASPKAYDVDLEAFREAKELDEGSSPEFIARVRLDGSGIDRLYKIDVDGSTFVWDDNGWDVVGTSSADIWTYDKALDDPYDLAERSHVVIDPDSAIIISARFQENPFANVSIEDIDADEARLFAEAMNEIDWQAVDYAMTAAGESTTAPAADGQYTPEERSKNAARQVRDGSGKFASAGSRVVVGGDTQNGVGTIRGINPDNGTVRVKYDNGTYADVPAASTEKVEKYVGAMSRATVDLPAIDTSGILAQPRTPIDRPDAQIPGTLPAMRPSDFTEIVNNYPAWVKSQRDQFKPLNSPAGTPPSAQGPGGSNITAKPVASPQGTTPTKAPAGATPLDRVGTPDISGTKGADILKMTGSKLTLDAYDHPLLASWLNKSVKNKKTGEVTYPNRLWYQPVTRASAMISSADAPVELTPDNSDVQPLFLALVSPDDPRAVMDLVSLVPANSKSNTPMTYKRVKGEWTRDEGILADLNSATPPPVVPLDSETLTMVLEQIDSGTVTASAMLAGTVDHILTVLWGPTLVAAGGADRNRGNAESLRRYWTRGEGALKIKWGTPGDWKRCVRHLSKYLGPRAKGYCQLRHKEATGVYTATHAKRDRARNNSVEEFGTTVTEEDMKMPIQAIEAEQDDNYESDWEPSEEIIVILVEAQTDVTILAAGGADRNRGNAEALRRYWTRGKGAAKIRWGTGGDWTRCVRYLSKYLGPRAKGYCALRHKEVTGLWTGDKKHRQMYGRKGRGRNAFSTDVIVTSDEFLEKATLSARAADARSRMAIVAGAYEISERQGSSFFIPLVIPEELESGDGRKFRKGAIDMRELPLPLMWQIKTGQGHDGSVVVGRIDRMERTEQGIGNAYGVFDSGEYGQEAERLVREGFIRGVSADMDKFEATEEKEEAGDVTEGKVGNGKIDITKARVMGVTIVPKPAFQECKIVLVENNELEEDSVIPDGVYVEDVDPTEAASLVACGFVAGAIPVVPPADWFENPNLKGPTPLTVTDEGRVFGHIAAWHVDHIGLSFGTKPPRSKSKYAYFHTGVVRTDAGKDVPVGQLTLAGGHASLEASAAEAARHYDDTASAVSDVHAGEDAYGIWVAGALRPGATPEQIRALRASAPSGDWRPIKGGLELVAVCQVNVPGFPIARARVASGQVMALVAAGAMTLAKMKSDPVTELAARIAKLEQLEKTELSNRAAEASARFTEVRAQRKAELTARMSELSSRVLPTEDYEDGFGYISREKRQKLAEKGLALPDGSFPIENVEALKDSIQAYGRGKKSKRAAIRRHIMKRARVLGKPELIPDEWKAASSEELEFAVNDLRSRIPAMTASGFNDFADVSDKVRERLAKEGKALADGSYPIRNASDLQNAIKACSLLNGEDRVNVLSHITKRANAIGKADLIPTEWTTASTVEENASLGKALAVEPTEPGAKYVSGKTQPRDAKGKFRTVLARLKQDLGESGLQNVVEKVAEAENLENAGNYVEAARSATDLIGIIDRIDSKALNPEALTNVREGARALGETIANLPLPFGAEATKVRFSDLPPALRDLVDDMISRVEDKIGKKDADVATEGLRSYMAGGDYLNQSQISSELSKMLRLLT